MSYLKLRDLNKHKPNWKFGPTSVSPQMESLQFGFPLPEDLPSPSRDEADKQSLLGSTSVSIPPASTPWLYSQRRLWLTPPKDQGECKSCVAFAICAVLESRAKISQRNRRLQLDLSEAHLFFCGCKNCCGVGWTYEPALDFCKNPGVGIEADFPYSAQDQECKEIVPAVKIKSYRILRDINERKAEIMARGAVMGAMRIYDDFFYYTKGIYRHETGEPRGGHAVAVVGFNDEEQYWLIKNSWGRGWGESGYAKIGYGAVDIDSGYPFYAPEVEVL